MTTHSNRIDAAWSIIEESGLQGLTIEALSNYLQIPITELNHLFPTRDNIVLMLHDDIHRKAMLTAVEDGSVSATSIHDKLFEIVMAHFDEMQDRRVAVSRLWHDMLLAPSFWWVFRPHFSAACQRVLSAAKVNTAGMLGDAKLQAFNMFCLSLMPVWLSDKSQDQSKTMSVLDGGLRRLGQAASYLQ